MAEGGFISVRSGPHGSSDGMSFMDIIVLLRAMESETEIDLTSFTTILRDNSFIFQHDYEVLLHRLSTSTGPTYEKMGLILSEIVDTVSFADVVTTLRLLGCDQIADVLQMERHNMSNSFVRILSSNASNSKHINKFYNSVKFQLISGLFHNKLSALDSLAIMFRNKALAEVQQRDRQRALDKLAIITCLQVHYLQNREAKHGILSNLTQGIPLGLDRQCVDMVLCIAKCMIEKKFGDHRAAKYHLDEAKSINSVCNDSFFGFLICHAQHLLYRTMYAKNPTGHNFKHALVACHLGMSRASPEPETIRQNWSRTFISFSALLILQIGQELAILHGNVPSEDTLKDAEYIVKTSKIEQGQWEPRREMMYCLCMARIKETSNLPAAIEYCKKAIFEAKLGAYTKTEKCNLKLFYKRLQARITV